MRTESFCLLAIFGGLVRVITCQYGLLRLLKRLYFSIQESLVNPLASGNGAFVGVANFFARIRRVADRYIDKHVDLFVVRGCWLVLLILFVVSCSRVSLLRRAGIIPLSSA